MLLSGGLDSVTALAWAAAEGYTMQAVAATPWHTALLSPDP